MVSKNTKATLKCCYGLHSCVGTILSNEWMHNTICPPEMEITHPKMVGGCPHLHTWSSDSHHMESICQWTLAYNYDIHTGWPTECSAEEFYNNSTATSGTCWQTCCLNTDDYVICVMFLLMETLWTWDLKLTLGLWAPRGEHCKWCWAKWEQSNLPVLQQPWPWLWQCL